MEIEEIQHGNISHEETGMRDSVQTEFIGLRKKSGATNLTWQRIAIVKFGCLLCLADTFIAVYMNEHVFHVGNVDDHWCRLVKILAIVAGGLQFMNSIKFHQTMYDVPPLAVGLHWDN